ncbi:MAG: 5'-nucleotidase C-terminal domain-containing protein [Deltaproteobacteria bacterium]|nr:MAG: 5'-nucleotidase C-terminal domain-containing protein [Deltaproteobacteria bacterium]
MKARFRNRSTMFSLLFLSLLVVSCATTHINNTSRELTILGTADLQGQLEPTVRQLDLDGDGTKEGHLVGGISRIASLVANVKVEKPGKVAVVSTGDDLMNRYFHTYKGRAIFHLLSEAGYDIYAFGNHEFDKGPQALSDALKHAGFQCICSDLSVKNTPLDGLCQPWLVRDYEGLKVGFFSLMTEDFPFVTSGKEVKLARGNLETARWAAKELRKRGAEIVVALTHLGYQRDYEIVEAVPEIDVIFGGHSHEYLPNPVRVGKAVIVNGGEKGSFLVRLDLVVDSNGRVDGDKVQYQLIPVTSDVVPDANVDAFLAQYQKSLPKAIVLGHTEVEWNMTDYALRYGESVVADLVNDLMREKFHVDIVLNNAGAFRGNRIYQPGPVTDVMLREIDEFSNYAYTVDIKGQYIKDILERSAASFGRGGFLHPSGLRYTIDLKETAQKISQNDAGQWTVDIPGERVKQIQVLDENGQWVQLDQEKTYCVLSNSFIVKQQGDGYFWFKRYGQNINNTYSTFYSILAELAASRGSLNPASPDGRLTAIR